MATIHNKNQRPPPPPPHPPAPAAAGAFFARKKQAILARLAGLPVESPTSFPVESLIPEELASAASGDEFLARLPEFDARMEEVRDRARREGKVVRYVGSVDVAAGRLKVGLETFDRAHPIAALKGSDNFISFYTKRYGDKPLIIQGAGAGGADAGKKIVKSGAVKEPVVKRKARGF